MATIPPNSRLVTSSALAMRGMGWPSLSKLISDGVSPPMGWMPKFR
jgi:hypothetical protein